MYLGTGNLIHAKAHDEGTGQQAQAVGPEGNVMVGRLLGSMEFGRPLSNHWSGTAGINFQRTRCTDDHGRAMTKVKHIMCCSNMRSPSAHRHLYFEVLCQHQLLQI